MSKFIEIGDVKIPFDDYVTQGTTILGIRGAGKTYTAKGVAEQLLDYNVPLVIFDAIGVWRFLKVAADKNGKAYKVVVAGGQHPDLPLTPQSAPQIVRAAMKENIPLVIDLYDTRLSKTDWRKIVQESFRILLYENVGLRHIFLEEAAEYVPQSIKDPQVYAEVEKVVRMGGNKSLGITMINQRSQELNKAVLELCDNLVMMKQKGYNAIAYAQKWADQLSPEMAREIAAKLPKVGTGDCWVFTDAYEDPQFTRSNEIKSFHPNRQRPEHPKNSAVADPTEFVERLATELPKILEESKANDPAELKRKLAEVERKLRIAEQKAPEVKQAEQVEVSVITKDDRDRLLRLEGMLNELCVDVRDQVGSLAGRAEGVHGEIGWLKSVLAPAVRQETYRKVLPPEAASITRTRYSPDPTPRQFASAMNGDDELTEMGRKFLTALAQHPDGLTKGQILTHANYTSSGPASSQFAVITRNGWAEGTPVLRITVAGKHRLGPYDPLPTGEKLQELVLSKADPMQRAFLVQLFDVYPGTITKGEILQRTGYTSSGPASSTFARLIRLGWAKAQGVSILKASDDFFK